MSRTARALPARRSLRLAAAAVLAAGACAGPSTSLYITVERYLAAMMQQDAEGMARVWAPYRRGSAGLASEEEKKNLAVFQSWIREARRNFEEAKSSGELAPDPLGVAMFRALGLGKGGTSVPLSAEVAADGRTARVRTRVLTNPDTLHLEALPDGVVVYLMGYPFGRLESVSVGFERLDQKRILAAVDIEWSLVHAPEFKGTPAGWLIESVSADPGSAVEWKPKPRGT